MPIDTFFAKRPEMPTFTKVADVRLPYDGNKWQEEIIGALHEQHPYLPDTQLQLSLNVRNVKEGYAIGNLNVSDRVRIPVVVDQFMLKPFDIFMKDGQLQPLLKTTLLSALEARNFGTATPPGQGESSDIFLTNSRPPFDGKYTFASWTEGTPEKVEKALSNVFGADGVEYFKAGDPAVKAVLEGARKGDYSKMKGTGTVKALETNAQRKIAKTAAVKLEDRPMDALTAGVVKVADAGGTMVDGLLFDRVYDLTFGGAHDAALFAASDLTGYDLNRQFYGSQTAKLAAFASVFSKLADPAPLVGETGLWFWTEQGKLACTSLTKIRDSLASGDTFFVGGPTQAVHRTIHKTASLAIAVMEGEDVYIPATARWMPVMQKRAMYGRPTPSFTRDYVFVQESHGNVKIAVYKDNMRTDLQDAITLSQAAKYLGNYFEPESVESTLSAARVAGSVKIAAHPGMFIREVPVNVNTKAAVERIRGNAKIATQALFAIKDTDVSRLASYDTTELAKVDPFSAAVIKAAAAIDEDDRTKSVDSVLGLNIINDQNTQKFLDGIDGLDRCKQFCMKLLLASRLGLNVDADAARTAAFALEDIIQDLEQLRHANVSQSSGE